MDILTIYKTFFKELILRILTINYFVIKKVIKKEFSLKKNEKILDLGCGTGILAQLFKPKNYIGIDIDRTLVAYSKKKYPLYEFYEADSSKFVSNASIDKILVVGVIHHLDKTAQKRTLQKINNYLKKNGVILLIEAISPINSWNIIGKFLRSHDEGHHILSFYEYEKLFSQFFTIKKSYKQPGGIFDYAVFVLTKKSQEDR